MISSRATVRKFAFLAKQAGDSSSDWLIGELVAGWQTVVEAKAN